jgi:hypothetical protein
MLALVAPGASAGLIGSPGSVLTHAEHLNTQETRFRSQAVRCTPATRQSNRNSLSEIAYLAKSLYSRSVQNENTFYFEPLGDPIPTAANRLVNAIPWLRAAGPGLYDGLDVPLSPAVGRLTRASTRKAPA